MKKGLCILLGVFLSINTYAQGITEQALENLQIEEDVSDDDTWMHHLRHGEYSQWMREAIKDNNLAQEVENIEKTELSAEASRAAIKAKIEQRYTAPA